MTTPKTLSLHSALRPLYLAQLVGIAANNEGQGLLSHMRHPTLICNPAVMLELSCLWAFSLHMYAAYYKVWYTESGIQLYGVWMSCNDGITHREEVQNTGRLTPCGFCLHPKSSRAPIRNCTPGQRLVARSGMLDIFNLFCFF